MASTYHFSSVPVPAGCSASAHYDYISREGKYSPERTGENDIITEEYGNMPDWAAGKPSEFWAAAERFGRSNGRSYREINVALQNELSLSDNMELVREFINESGIADEHAYYYSIHARMTADNKQQNIHAHIMFNEKIIEPDRPLDRYDYFRRYAENDEGRPTSGYRTSKKHSSKEGILADRQLWERLVNQKFRERDIDERVSAKSLKAQREELLAQGRTEEAELLNRTPAPHIGPLLRNEKARERLIERIRQFETEIKEEKTEQPAHSENTRKDETVQQPVFMNAPDYTEEETKKQQKAKPTTSREELEAIEDRTERLIAIYAHDYVIRQTAKQIQKERVAEHKKTVEQQAEAVAKADMAVTIDDISKALKLRRTALDIKMKEYRKDYTATKAKIVPDKFIYSVALNRMTDGEYDRARKQLDALNKKIDAIKQEARSTFEYYSHDREYYATHQEERDRLWKPVNDWLNQQQGPLYIQQSKLEQRIEEIEKFPRTRKEEYDKAVAGVHKENDTLLAETKGIGKEYGKLKREAERIDYLRDEMATLDENRVIFAAKVERILTRNDKINGKTPIKTLEKFEYDGEQYFITGTHAGGEDGGYKTAVKLHDNVTSGSVPTYEIRYHNDGTLSGIFVSEERTPLYAGRATTKEESFKTTHDPAQAPPVQEAAKYRTIQTAALAAKAAVGLLSQGNSRKATANKRTKIRFRKDDHKLTETERILRQYFSDEADVMDDLPDNPPKHHGITELLNSIAYARSGGNVSHPSIKTTHTSPVKTTIGTNNKAPNKPRRT